jgi:hypothetical protein
MENDISRNTIFVLVVLTLLISILGTWTVLTQLNNTPMPQQYPAQGQTSGHVSFALAPPAQPSSSQATGHVAFTIAKK